MEGYLITWDAETNFAIVEKADDAKDDIKALIQQEYGLDNIQLYKIEQLELDISLSVDCIHFKGE